MPDDYDKIQTYWDNEYESHTYQACEGCPHLQTWVEAHGERMSACAILDGTAHNMADARCIEHEH